MSNEPRKQQKLASKEISCELENVYGWMKQMTFVRPKHPLKGSVVENRTCEYCTPPDPISTAGDATSKAKNLAAYSAYSSPNKDSFKEEEVSSSASQKPCFTLAKDHALSGAFAGIFVSLCLHPLDTIKTVAQTCHAEQKSLFHIGRSIVSDRGLTGIYQGMTAKLVSSAPISAIYTLTYESIKGSLVPISPNRSFAHCVAGGCASIATSFVFTPSERIKQQMQVSTHCHSCWKAMVGTVQKGGLPSLYAGWGAVLCRNVPHSIIKFYTYESLKQLMSSSLPSSTQLNTLQTLVCGGLAGSTAAFFTTPFDVVKTRLQTQMPGSSSQYNSVVHALYEIRNNEGVKGLYRGLTPRLVMYISQGALFFASYETFKRVFALDKPRPKAERIQYQENTKDDSFIPSPSSALKACE